jgi:hypothetical protein
MVFTAAVRANSRIPREITERGTVLDTGKVRGKVSDATDVALPGISQG